jgi:UDP-N-acetylmuramyl tripeptide synthase
MKILAILISKMLSFAGKLLGKGSSLPGKIALKLCPNILSRLILPASVIAVTGSNGKTSTVEMIANVLIASGKKVVWNKEGSNQIEGVTTLLLNNATLTGKVKGDVVLLESDERYARHTMKFIKPTDFVITNLYRDQLTRNAHPFHIYGIIKEAVDLIPNARLVLNADDPIVRKFGVDRENVVYFGIDKNAYCAEETDGVYNDCFYCPVCKKPLSYEYFHYAHLGKYACSCGYSRPDTTYTVTKMDLENNSISVNDDEIRLAFSSRYNVYNLCAAYATAALVGVDGKCITDVLSDFVMKNGRNVRFAAGQNGGMLITSKHENSTSYNQSLEYVARQETPATLIIIVDAISRKYYTAETSWLWDISFEMLKNSNLKQIILSGKYAYDLALRFEYVELGNIPVVTEPDLDKMAAMLADEKAGPIFAVTCFSDKEKLLSRVKVLKAGE